MSSKFGSSYSKAIAGTGALITVSCGFRPSVIKVVNRSIAISLEWFEGLGNGCGLKRVAGTTNSVGDQSVVTSNGITVYDGYFTIGTDSVNAAPTVTTTATGSKGAYTIVVASASNMAVGQHLYGAGIQAGSRITAISGTTITLSHPLTAAMSSTACGVANLVIFAE